MHRSSEARRVVLIVEDEVLVRMDARDIVEAAGFDALEAGSADEAIALLESHRDIEIVFTDVQMPGTMDGLKLAKAVRGRWPPIKILATSGLRSVDQRDLPAGSSFVPKPYTAAEIDGALRELIAA